VLYNKSYTIQKRMELKVLRYHDTKDATLGLLFVDGVYECHTLEDEYRKTKVKHETRVPAGVYDIRLRTEGGFHHRYMNKFGKDFHEGMLHVQDVPNFEYILIHIGNHDGNTSGCLLVGKSCDDAKEFVGNSTGAYLELYPKVLKAIKKGKKVTIEYTDLDRNFTL
jgi:hypothetical protein